MASEAETAVCLESYVGELGGPDGIRPEQQLLITERGTELLSSYPVTLA